MKNVVYKDPVRDIAELQRRINDEITSISKQTLCNVFQNIVKRMNLCIHADGGHFEHLLYINLYEIKLQETYYHYRKKKIKLVQID